MLDAPAGQAVRLFLALWPDAGVRRQLSQFARQWRGRRIPAARLHMTLVFLGAVDAGGELASVQRIAGQPRGEAFELYLDRTGYFAGRPGTAWVGPSRPPQALLELQQGLREELRDAGLRPDARRFVPHVSLLRSARPPATAVPGIRWPVQDFVLVASRQSDAGLRYDILQRQVLGSDPGET